MLSDNLATLAQQMRYWADTGGVQLHPAACRALGDSLDLAAEAAGMLQAAIVPVGYRLPDPPPPTVHVVDFRSARQARERARSNDWAAFEGGIA